MDFNEYQEKAQTILENFKSLDPKILKMFSLAYCGLGLGECGEVQGKIKKMIRDDGGEITVEKKEAIIGELGNILWYVAGLCTELNVTMDAVAECNVKKLFSRKNVE